MKLKIEDLLFVKNNKYFIKKPDENSGLELSKWQYDFLKALSKGESVDRSSAEKLWDPTYSNNPNSFYKAFKDLKDKLNKITIDGKEAYLGNTICHSGGYYSLSELEIDSEGEEINTPYPNNVRDIYEGLWNRPSSFEDRNSGITLGKLYIPPEYTNRNTPYDRIQIEELFKSHSNGVTLILGDPGSGKSSIISFFLNVLKCKLKDDRPCFVYRFASSFFQRQNFKSNCESIVDTLLKDIKSKTPDHKLSNTAVFIDGFDEINNIDERQRNYFLQYLDMLTVYIDQCSCYVLCRKNYLPSSYLSRSNYNIVNLENFSDEQISKFYYKYQEIKKKTTDDNVLNELCKRHDVTGIPVLLHMILNSEVKLNEASSYATIYREAFNNLFTRAWSISQPIEIESYKNFYRKISHEVALLKLSLDGKRPLEDCHGCPKSLLVEFVQQLKNKLKIEDDLPLLIGNYFTTEEMLDSDECYIDFIHRSIYEFFIADYFYQTIKENLYSIDTEWFTRDIGSKLKFNSLSEEMIEDFNVLVREDKESVKIKEKLKEAVIQWLFSHTFLSGSAMFKHVYYELVNEKTGFLNLLGLLFRKGWFKRSDFSNSEYLEYSQTVGFYLSDIGALTNGISLPGFDFEGMELMYSILLDSNLNNTNMKNIKLMHAIMTDCSLVNSQLDNADLRHADLTGADLTDAKLLSADLRYAILRQAELKGADLTGADLRNAILSYAEIEKSSLEKVGYAGLLEGAIMPDGITFSHGSKFDDIKLKQGLPPFVPYNNYLNSVKVEDDIDEFKKTELLSPSSPHRKY